MVATAAPGHLATAGVATRGLALATDAALANLIVLMLGALIGLVASLVGGDLHPQWLAALLAASGWAIIVGGYFTLFW